ncbi:hypothetical protein [Erythrobacter tepidarius]|uniref:hypothetical protein n=1 Tax=Erythrobacter tepidarius TaxID=60454 RepID=UPI000A36E995|nr:hypothetical protein [Erythrobacter tepidarius]
MRRAALSLLPALLAAACSDAPSAGVPDEPFATDPLVAAVLHDPLMSDPDLSARNEANALLGFSDTALPLLPATPEAAQAAREAGRLELLSEGPIMPLPSPVAAPFALPVPGAKAQDALAAIGAPQTCIAGLEEGFGWAAKLPQAAAIMPQGMVVQAGGRDAAGCRLRVIRYYTAAPDEDVLQYHYVRAGRAGLAPQRHRRAGEGPGASITARGASGEALLVTVRKAAGGLTAVDLYYRAG